MNLNKYMTGVSINSICNAPRNRNRKKYDDLLGLLHAALALAGTI